MNRILAVLIVVIILILVIGLMLRIHSIRSIPKKIRKKGVKTQGTLVNFERTYSEKDDKNNYELMMYFTYIHEDIERPIGLIRAVVNPSIEARLNRGMILPVMYNKKIEDVILFERDLDSAILDEGEEMTRRLYDELRLKGFPHIYRQKGEAFSYDKTKISVSMQKMIDAMQTIDIEAAKKLVVLAEKLEKSHNIVESKQIEKEIEDIHAKVRQSRDEQSLKEGSLSEEMLNIAQNGEKAEAVVLDTTFTGRHQGEMSEVILKLRVMSEYRDEYETEVTKHVFPASFFSVVPGNVLRVYYMPDNPHKLTVGFPTV